jgi:hypothetical protein
LTADLQDAAVMRRCRHQTQLAEWKTGASQPLADTFDEVGYYCVTGMAIMAAQGRSLGFSLVFATQDIPAITAKTTRRQNPSSRILPLKCSCGWKKTK